ncbi:cobalt-zinc-cadmium efflux system protein [Salinibacillus kushneri]|uniref:Cobalt-zinc-cadmium efflux system protein n=1 Tax=Salinibacillus kushneri TaxID=237682 RepID=A0A1I0AMH1_9BACI|nr:cation diffusion facilitator family transporter [Salinibacillus kushneri]SES95503.1 cobalt-zinc-cadmium efflux system protein [Salinibacillus kushneri]
MGHNHDHEHHHHNANKKALLISFCLITTFMVVEVIGGFLTNSLALISDAGHMLSDAASLGLSLLAFKIGEKAANKSKTYGYKRFEILAAFFNGIALLAISLYIFWEAYHRFLEPPNVGAGMLIIASIGFVVNIFVAWILMKGDTEENLNLRSAFLHVLGDLLGSVGAMVAGLFIIFFDWNIADPVASVIVSILVLISGWRVTKDSIHVLMEGKPSHIEMDLVENTLCNISGVKEVHDLHVWTITSDFPTLTCHLIVEKGIDRDSILEKASDLLHNKFELHHTTIQIEGDGSKFRQKEDNCN